MGATVTGRPCWCYRLEAEGYADIETWLDGTSADRCDAIVAAAAPDPADPDGRLNAIWDYVWSACLLPAGHAGAHAFTPNRLIGLTFDPDPQAPGGVRIGLEIRPDDPASAVLL